MKEVIMGLASLLLFNSGMPFSEAARQTPEEAKLVGILVKAQEYCRRLDKAALDFVCREVVEEEVNKASKPSATAVQPNATDILGRPTTRVVPTPAPSFRTTTFLYDYQFIHKGGEVRERRNLMEKDGKKAEQADVAPETKHFKFRDIFFGASVLLGESAAARYDYKIVKDDKLKGDPVTIIAAVPKPGNVGRVLSGRSWVRIRDGAVLKIDWDPESFGSYDEVRAIAERLKMSPAIESTSEFGVEKNGLRFPSLDVTEEAYGSGNIKFVRSTTTIQYKGYKFFTVETAIDIR